ncbi:uncharacterized protein FA14DRAFT_63321 [Meira miltonrushii]|uniref:Uncharacterized protein n=1 Tax=Meira miltonrushii TaxID=1280837 RepID=A0A316V7T0_9BASI|nr:uncharacterized protein FA14DRAFT_63321 [Meira miltonrushii]PWN33560.1 hypothetical protein FA14DRAFT_63321 [Meira miltonrushii]
MNWHAPRKMSFRLKLFWCADHPHHFHMFFSKYFVFVIFIAVGLAQPGNGSHTIGKRQLVPDLNGPPPVDNDHPVIASVSTDYVTQDLSSSMQVTKNREQNRKRNRPSVIDLNECYHHKGCEHWKSLPSIERDRISKKNWMARKPDEVRKQMSREYSKKWHSKLTREQKEVRNQRMRITRLRKKQKATPGEKGAEKGKG